MRLTKYNPDTGLYEYKEKARTQAEYNEQRKAVIQRLGEYEDKEEGIANYATPTCDTIENNLVGYCGECGKGLDGTFVSYCPQLRSENEGSGR